MTPADRFWTKVDRRADDECWPWLATTFGPGYGMFWMAGRRTTAHRAAYQLAVGEIPPGLQIDHLCRNPGCVNPAHLEPVTNRENTLRGLRGRLRSQCVHGHPYTPGNTMVEKDGRRRCRTCKYQRTARYRARIR